MCLCVCVLCELEQIQILPSSLSPLPPPSPPQIPDYRNLDRLLESKKTVLVVGGGFLGTELSVGMATRCEWGWQWEELHVNVTIGSICIVSVICEDVHCESEMCEDVHCKSEMCEDVHCESEMCEECIVQG